MKNIEILTERVYQYWPSWSVVYEWEDILSEVLDCPLKPLYGNKLFVSKIRRQIRKIMRRMHLTNSIINVKENNPWKIIFVMDAKYLQLYSYTNIIPIFLDFSQDEIYNVLYGTQKLPCFFVTSYDIYEKLKNEGIDNVFYIPLSISDIYKTEIIPVKDIDVIQFGRKNKILHSYMLHYISEHPEVEYVYQTDEGSLTYVSSIRGDLGKFDDRQDYMKLLSRCRVSLVSTPGFDKSRNFGDIDFFTPRFYESAVSYCHMLGRYTQNKECDIIGISDICPYVDTYESFREYLDTKLAEDNVENKVLYKKFLENNLTSKRAYKIKEVLKAYI